MTTEELIDSLWEELEGEYKEKSKKANLDLRDLRQIRKNAKMVLKKIRENAKKELYLRKKEIKKLKEDSKKKEKTIENTKKNVYKKDYEVEILEEGILKLKGLIELVSELFKRKEIPKEELKRPIFSFLKKRKFEKEKSIHLTDWPKVDFKKIDTNLIKKFISLTLILRMIRQVKSIAKKSMNAEIILTLKKEMLNDLKLFLEDLKAVTNAKEIKEGKFKVEFI